MNIRCAQLREAMHGQTGFQYQLLSSISICLIPVQYSLNISQFSAQLTLQWQCTSSVHSWAMHGGTGSNISCWVVGRHTTHSDPTSSSTRSARAASRVVKIQVRRVHLFSSGNNSIFLGLLVHCDINIDLKNKCPVKEITCAACKQKSYLEIENIYGQIRSLTNPLPSNQVCTSHNRCALLIEKSKSCQIFRTFESSRAKSIPRPFWNVITKVVCLHRFQRFDLAAQIL